MQQLNYNLSEIKSIATALWNEHSTRKIWAFHANMGSGKTTFIHAICNVLKVRGAVSSPTFAIINEYQSAIAGTIFHMDWYRLKDEAEAMQAGCEDCIESGNYCFIEWPEKFLQLLPENTLHISLETVNNQQRKLTINKFTLYK